MTITPYKPYFWRVLMAAPLILLAAAGAWIASRLALWVGALSLGDPAVYTRARAADLVGYAIVSAALAGAGALIGACGACAAMSRSRRGLAVHRAVNLIGLALLVLFMFAVFTLVSQASQNFAAPFASPDPPVLRSFGAVYWPASLLALALLAAWVGSLRGQTIGHYTGQYSDQPAIGDRIIEDIRVFGRDPRYRGSWMGSAFVHVFILFILPWLMSLRGCNDAYYIPEGSGNPVVMLVQAVKPKEKKPREYILRPDSAIRFDVPDLDETEIEKEILEETEREYVADTTRVGRIGEGGGEEGGWPEGMGREPVRFIRLQYNGREWDDGMGSDGADQAFLDFFEQATGFDTAQSEAKRITELDNFKKGFAPPFVFMTGDSGIRVSRSEIQVLREYLLDGGMLFADCGHRDWDRAFRSFIKQVLPDKRLVVIADDDPIFRQPFRFPNGAPPVWGHGGRKALGVKHKGRWIVFYHPGDLNDAWKGREVSGLAKHQTKGAFEMGLNITYYAFTNYLEETRKYRK